MLIAHEEENEQENRRRPDKQLDGKIVRYRYAFLQDFISSFRFDAVASEWRFHENDIIRGNLSEHDLIALVVSIAASRNDHLLVFLDSEPILQVFADPLDAVIFARCPSGLVHRMPSVVETGSGNVNAPYKRGPDSDKECYYCVLFLKKA
jgi:hypothetical protein